MVTLTVMSIRVLIELFCFIGLFDALLLNRKFLIIEIVKRAIAISSSRVLGIVSGDKDQGKEFRVIHTPIWKRLD